MLPNPRARGRAHCPTRDASGTIAARAETGTIAALETRQQIGFIYAVKAMASEFTEILETMAGTKQSIQQAKEWMLARPAAAPALAVALREYVVRGAAAAKSAGAFAKILYAIYLLNDVFFNSGKDDPYRRGFYPELATVVHAASRAAPDDGAREKVLRVVELWGTKKVFPAQSIQALRDAAKTAPPPPPPAAPAPPAAAPAAAAPRVVSAPATVPAPPAPAAAPPAPPPDVAVAAAKAKAAATSQSVAAALALACLLYTSDAADEG